jgi:nitrogen fixation NifU-like protein
VILRTPPDDMPIARKEMSMSDSFDAFVNDLQEKIFAETREVFGEAGFQRWRNPRYRGPLADADAHARVKGSCGDTMQIFLKFENNYVVDAAYLTDGCGSSTVCGSFAAEMAIGSDVDALAAITGEAILEKLGRMPEEDRHCAFLAAATVQEALHNYMIGRKADR